MANTMYNHSNIQCVRGKISCTANRLVFKQQLTTVSMTSGQYSIEIRWSAATYFTDVLPQVDCLEGIPHFKCSRYFDYLLK